MEEDTPVLPPEENPEPQQNKFLKKKKLFYLLAFGIIIAVLLIVILRQQPNTNIAEKQVNQNITPAQNLNTTTTDTPATSHTLTPSKLLTPIQDIKETTSNENSTEWNVYTSQKDGISFKYPPDWKIISETKPNGSSWYQQVDLAPTTGNANFRLIFRALDNPTNNSDTSRCSYIKNIKNLNVPSHKTINIIAYGVDNKISHMALTDNPNLIIGQEAGCSAVFRSKAGSNKYIGFHGYFGQGVSGINYYNFEEFMNTTEVQAAKKILESVAY